jgi:3-phosphoglycerate kinase
VVGIADYLPAVAGHLMSEEIEMLTEALESDASPSVALVGGAKVADKIKVLDSLSQRFDVILIGGGMTAAFLRAQGKHAGKAKVTEEEVHAAGRLLFSSSAEVVVPVDVVTAEEFSADAKAQIRTADSVRPKDLVLDIGPETTERYSSKLRSARRIVWNGPMGVAEWPQFAAGTHAVARAIAAAPNAFKVIGGGSTAAVIEELGLAEHMTHVSTGGGASLEFLEGRTLPGVAALDDLDD